MHPISDSARGFFFLNGDCNWVSKSLQVEFAFSEILFCHGHLRTSVACAFSCSEVSWITLILEDTHGWGLAEKWAAVDLTMTSYAKVPDDWPSAGLQLKGKEKILAGVL